MDLEETLPPKLPTEISYNVINMATGKQLNLEPLTEEAAHKLANQLHESDAGLPLIIRSNRAILME